MNSLKFYRSLVILNGSVPLVVLCWDAYRGQLGANSVNYALHVTGILSLLFLIFSLLMTPLRWLTNWGGWVGFRRSLGLYGFFYAVLHVIIYVGFDRALDIRSTFEEIWMRRFLQVGTAAVFLMVPLAATSTNAMIQRLGPKRWKLLHRLAYLIVILGVVHYYMLVKSDVRQPIAFGIVVGVLLASRFVKHYVDLRQAAFKNSSRNTAAMQNALAKEKPNTNDTKKPTKFWSGELAVAAIVQETPDVKTFRLCSPEGGPLPFEFLPGQYMNLQLAVDGKRVNRSYTIASSPTRRDTCELTIKRETLGVVSRHLHDNLNVGSKLHVSAPAGRFTFTGDKERAILLIAGGVGITPLMSIARYLTDRAWSGDLYFLVIAKTERDIIFKEELQSMQRRFPSLHLCITLTRTEPESMWQGELGRASGALLQRFVPGLTDMPVYLCGPNEMMEATRQLLIREGVPEQRIKTEAFVSPRAGASTGVVLGDATIENTMVSTNPVSDSNTASDLLESSSFGEKSRSITFSKSNRTMAVSRGTTVLEAAEQCSIDLPFDCRSGVCGQCKTKLLEGSVVMESHDALSLSEQRNGWILACQASPQNNIVVDA
jgi:glycine betaine catabolism B